MKILRIITKINASLLVLLCSVNIAYSQSISDFSVLPETMASPPDQTPNVLIVLDSSGSMLDNESNTRVGAYDATSRSYQVRQVLRDLLDDNLNDMNVGLMTFGNSGPSGALRWNDGFDVQFTIENCNEYAPCASPVKAWGTRDLTGKGFLLENVIPLDSTHNARLKTFLATEPRTPSFGLDTRFGVIDGDDWITNGGFYYLHDPNDNLLYNNIITSAGGTPLTGSLQTAKSYLLDNNLTSSEVRFAVADAKSPIITTSGISTQCLPNTYVFLITDGLPTIQDDGGGIDTNGDFVITDAEQSAEVDNVATAAKALYDNGVETWVFGYSLPAGADAYMNTIASSGSNNTRSAFIASDAATLRAQLKAALDEVTRIGGSSSGISVIASSSDAAGSVVQAIYQPELIGQEDDPNSNDPNDKIDVSVAWTSTLSSFFIDEFGYLREDNPSAGTQGQLDSYAIDKAFRLGFNDMTQEVEVTRLSPTGLETSSFNENPNPTTFKLEDLNPVWEAGEVLSSYPQNSATTPPVNLYADRNRPYDKIASATDGYRRMYSWIQSVPGSTAFDTGEQIEFIYSDTSGSKTINPGNYTLLDTPTTADAKNVVDYIRGKEDIPGFRNRSIDGQAYLLGDIVHSTAAQVDIPGENYGSRFNDSSYTAFKDHYKYRRRMVYVGANDGLLHAFNGGFWDGGSTKYYLKASEIGCSSNCDQIPHELGAEVWAYAPMNLLPHLKFLTDPNYSSSAHISYVDGAVSVFDVRAFTPDNTHINGWGTILVVGMRLGGGEYNGVDHDADGSAGDEFTARSAYVIIDVTDPTDEPKVIGEITHENLGFTVGRPDIMKEGDDWYVVFGSGPTEIKSVTSTQKARLFRYKINQGSRGFDSKYNGTESQAFGADGSFVGDIRTHDWNSDFNDDAVYFGTISGTETAADGAIYRYVSSNSGVAAAGDVKQLLNTNKPIFHAPLLRTTSSQNWVFFGSGRYLTARDAEENTERNRFYGVREPVDTNGERDYSKVTGSSLINMTAVKVKNDGELINSPVSGVNTYNELRRHIVSTGTVGGWFFNLPRPSPAPSAKASASPLAFKDILFQTYYEPPVSDGNLCSNNFGSSFLRAVDTITGIANFTPDFDGVLGTDNNDVLNDTVRIGDGYAYTSYLFVGPDPETGKNRILIKSPLSTGEIADTEVAIPPGPNGRTSWREIQIQ